MLLGKWEHTQSIINKSWRDDTSWSANWTNMSWWQCIQFCGGGGAPLQTLMRITTVITADSNKRKRWPWSAQMLAVFLMRSLVFTELELRSPICICWGWMFHICVAAPSQITLESACARDCLTSQEFICVTHPDDMRPGSSTGCSKHRTHSVRVVAHSTSLKIMCDSLILIYIKQLPVFQK